MGFKNLAAFVTLAACFGAVAPDAHANGMIIPAYLPLTDSTSWQILEEDAAIIRDGSNANYKDYWVTVNSSNNGPFSTPSDWTTAATRFNPIRANSGKIFGYVHTLTTPTSITYRSLASVEADITAWVSGYPNIDGIWIDEFYPRYEIATDTDNGATFPNGEALAPTNRSFLNPDGTFNANQVNPAGGYYSQLTGWIHSTYPNLILIGNSGGKFYSNQLNYGNLVDVTCSFEQTYDYASANGWLNLERQIVSPSSKQLALIHTNSTDLNGAIDQSISHGYTHFYTTNGVLTNNIWGALPPYFTTEVQYIANHS